MFEFPNSSAMDVAASGGGPSTFLFQIVTGQPEQIAQHSTSLLAKAEQFTSLLNQFTQATQQMSKVWSGSASESAVKKITDSLSAFEKIIKVVENTGKLLGISGTMVKSAQTAYTGVVSSVNPTVAGLISNWWTYSAGVALATSTSAALRAFITAVEGMLQSLGGVQLAAELAAIAQLITTIEQLFAGPKAAAATGNMPSTQLTSTPITLPQSVPNIASTSGQQALSGTSPSISTPAFPTTTGTATGATPTGVYPTTGTTGGYPTGTNPTGTYPTGTYPSTSTVDPNANSWIPVDPSGTGTATGTTPATGTAAATNPATTAPATGQEVKVTTTDHGITTTVEVPAGQAANIDLNVNINNDHVSEHFNIGANGSVSVS